MDIDNTPSYHMHLPIYQLRDLWKFKDSTVRLY